MNAVKGDSAIAWRRSASRMVLCDMALPSDLIETLWTEPDALVAAGEPLQRKSVRQTVLIHWASRAYVLKHYVEPTWRHALKQLAQQSRARTTWTVTHRLADAGVATPRAVACVENRWGALRRDSYLMYPYVEGRTLRSCLSDGGSAISSTVSALWRQLGALWQRLVELRVSLGDTNVGNFIVCPAGQLWVIDLDKARFHRLPYLAARHQQRGWKQLLRSAAKC